MAWEAEVTCTGFDKVRAALSMEGAGLRVAMAAQRGMLKHVPVDTNSLRYGAYPGDMEVNYSRGPASSYAAYVYGGRDKKHARTPGTDLDWPGAYQAAGAPEVCEEIGRVIADAAK